MGPRGADKRPGAPLVFFPKICIMHDTMYRAEVEPMPENPADRVPYTGLYRVVIYEGTRFVRSDKDRISYREAKRLAGELNGKLNIAPNARRAGQT